MPRVTLCLIVTAALLLAPSVAFAHPGHGESSLLAGFIHPFGGIDHLLAMTAVGLFAFILAGVRCWQCRRPSSALWRLARVSVPPACRCPSPKLPSRLRFWYSGS